MSARDPWGTLKSGITGAARRQHTSREEAKQRASGGPSCCQKLSMPVEIRDRVDADQGRGVRTNATAKTPIRGWLPFPS